jgi:hypothetical protein
LDNAYLLQKCPLDGQNKKLQEDFTMTRTIEYYRMRIHKLEQRDESVNRNIINKLKRKVRALENAGQE